MIRLSVTQATIVSAAGIVDINLTYGPYQLTLGPGALVGGSTSTALCEELDIDTIQQGTERIGTLRDSAVKHISAEGDIVIPLGGCVFTNSTPAWFSMWGVDEDRSKTWPYLEWLSSDGLYRWAVHNLTIRYAIFYSGEHCCVAAMWHRDDYTRTSVANPLSVKHYGAMQYGYLQKSSFTGSQVTRTVVNCTPDSSLANVSVAGTWYPVSSEGLAPYLTGSTNLVTQLGVTSGQVGDPDTIFEEARTALVRQRWFDELCFERPESFDFGELSAECLDQLKVIDQNILFLVFDIADWRNIFRNLDAKGFIKAYEDVEEYVKYILNGPLSKTAKMARIREVFSDYLWKKYALDTLVGDLRRIQEGLMRFISQDHTQRLHSRRQALVNDVYGHASTYTAVLTVEVDEYPQGFWHKVQGIIGELKKWGIYPRLTDLWDILPYSFVVDWFVDWGGFFDEAAEWLEVRDYFPVHYCIQSEKWLTTVEAERMVPYQATGSVEISFYNRWIRRSVPLPPVSLGLGPGLTNVWVQATALVVQRSRPRHRSL